MRVIIQQGSSYIDGDDMPASDVARGFVALTPDINKAHNFRAKEAARTWLSRKDLTGDILVVEDVAAEAAK